MVIATGKVTCMCEHDHGLYGDSVVGLLVGGGGGGKREERESIAQGRGRVAWPTDTEVRTECDH